MHERAKLDEAAYFFSTMERDRNEPIQFKYALSAFLSAARSVLQYSLEEAKTHARGQVWYQCEIGARPIVAFMKEQRDTNIHSEPVALHNDVTIILPSIVAVVSVAGAIVQRSDGTRQEVTSDGSFPTTIPVNKPPTAATYTFRFPGWQQPHDVLGLSAQYLEQVRQMVMQGIAAGILQG